MACLREQTAEGRSGTIRCDEEGCQFGLTSFESSIGTRTEPSEAHCILQLRLRAGDPSESGSSSDVHTTRDVQEAGDEAVGLSEERIKRNPYQPGSEEWHRYNLGIRPGVIGHVEGLEARDGGLLVKGWFWEVPKSLADWRINPDTNEAELIRGRKED